MFSVTGTFRGDECTLTWDNGQLTGPELLLISVRVKARSWEGIAVNLPGGRVFGTHDHLNNAGSVMAIAYSVMDSVTKLGGDMPSPGRVPPGAIP